MLQVLEAVPPRQVGVIVEIDPGKIRPFRGQPRKHFDEKKLASLKASIAEVGQRQAVTVREVEGDLDHDFELIDGERRLRACNELGIPVRAVVEDVESPEYQFERAVIANFNRADHTPLEIARALARLRDSRRIRAFPKREQISAIARMFGHSEKWVYDYLGLLRLVPEIRDLLEPNVSKDKRVPLSLAIKLSSFDRRDQLAMYHDIKKRGLGFSRAVRLIGEVVNREGLHKHRKGRKPSDNLKIFESFLRRLLGDAEGILELSEEDFTRMLSARSDKERARMVAQLDVAVETLGRIRVRLV